MTKFLVIFASLFLATGASAADNTITCVDDSGVTVVALKQSGGKSMDISWQQSRSEPAKKFSIISETPGDKLWPSLPNVDSKAWPIGSYVGQLDGETVILTIARRASAGGGGYEWEGMMTYLMADSKIFTWGMYCSR
jgi:hypothetical protein